ncbi:DNA polymerase IV, partial [Halobacteriales archaeon QH_7_66_37]
EDPDLVASIASTLFEEFEGEQVRKLGVRVSNLSFAAGDQPSLQQWAGDLRDDVTGGGSGEDATETAETERANGAEGREPPSNAGRDDDGQRRLGDFQP